MNAANPLVGNIIYASKSISVNGIPVLNAGAQLTIERIVGSDKFHDTHGNDMPVIIVFKELVGMAFHIDVLENFCDEMQEEDVKWYFDDKQKLNNRIKKYE